MAVKETIKEVTIKNKLGLHARPASLFVLAASRFESEITVSRKDGGEPADGKSLMSMLILKRGQVRLRLLRLMILMTLRSVNAIVCH